MARQRIHNNRAGRGNGGTSWISYSDMMAALLLVFVLILCISLYQYFTMLSTKEEELASQQAVLDAQSLELDAARADLTTKEAELTANQQALEEKEAALLANQAALDAANADLLASQAALTEKE